MNLDGNKLRIKGEDNPKTGATKYQVDFAYRWRRVYRTKDGRHFYIRGIGTNNKYWPACAMR